MLYALIIGAAFGFCYAQGRHHKILKDNGRPSNEGLQGNEIYVHPAQQ